MLSSSGNIRTCHCSRTGLQHLYGNHFVSLCRLSDLRCQPDCLSLSINDTTENCSSSWSVDDDSESSRCWNERDRPPLFSLSSDGSHRWIWRTDDSLCHSASSSPCRQRRRKTSSLHSQSGKRTDPRVGYLPSAATTTTHWYEQQQQPTLVSLPPRTGTWPPRSSSRYCYGQRYRQWGPSSPCRLLHPQVRRPRTVIRSPAELPPHVFMSLGRRRRVPSRHVQWMHPLQPVSQETTITTLPLHHYHPHFIQQLSPMYPAHHPIGTTVISSLGRTAAISTTTTQPQQDTTFSTLPTRGEKKQWLV